MPMTNDNPPFRRYRVSIPSDDDEFTAWIHAQSNVSRAFYLAAKFFHQCFGATSVTAVPWEVLRDVGDHVPASFRGMNARGSSTGSEPGSSPVAEPSDDVARDTPAPVAEAAPADESFTGGSPAGDDIPASRDVAPATAHPSTAGPGVQAMERFLDEHGLG